MSKIKKSRIITTGIAITLSIIFIMIVNYAEGFYLLVISLFSAVTLMSVLILVAYTILRNEELLFYFLLAFQFLMILMLLFFVHSKIIVLSQNSTALLIIESLFFFSIIVYLGKSEEVLKTNILHKECS